MYGDVDQRIENLIRDRVSVPAGMKELIHFCTEFQPSSVWPALMKLDFEQDQRDLSAWLRDLLANEPPGTAITGFWFGLFNPYLEDGQPTSCLYLAGSQRFDPNRQVVDWHCGPEYFPEGRYSKSVVLTAIYRKVSENDDVSALGEYSLCLGYACLVVANWCRGAMREELLAAAEVRGVAVGFDSGDLVMIDVLRRKRSGN